MQDERLYAIGVCVSGQADPIATANFPRDIQCAGLPAYTGEELPVLHSARGLLHVAVRPLEPEDAGGAQLVLVHDMSFVERRSAEMRRYLFYFFVALGASVALITVVIAQVSWRGWVQGIRELLRGENILQPAAATAPEFDPIAGDLRELIRDLERQYRPLDGSQRIWDRQSLRATLRSELHGDDVIVVANREP